MTDTPPSPRKDAIEGVFDDTSESEVIERVSTPVPDRVLGKVYLVGAGPGDPGLLTLKGKALLECADVVVYDALVSPPIVAMINPQAERIDAGKRRGRHSRMQAEITQMLIEKAQVHAIVVRLKGGDPFIFGRGGEEMEDLVRAGVSVEVVPGITSGIAAPAYAGIPLTHRNYSSSVTFVTGHESIGKYRPAINWQALAQGSETIVVYMGIHNLPHIVAELDAAGMSPTTPIALIRWGTRPEQEELIGTLGTIVLQMAAAGFEAPAIAVIGSVVHLRGLLGQAERLIE
ncbi:uroporphyrinogen-III C-methyltransferase [Leptolyngbya sp. 'hensonii']|uniref:uroporphyrinogen-III C-methyltransferase n=1 Tax=Leptolyngbya sp. 'hensonii' TaxID=1922337 RepID=UPI0009FA478F|nr:uroporphyrinogen-III C-methyltransferase [Leptolyngbya sp. 'hensonii']